MTPITARVLLFAAMAALAFGLFGPCGTTVPATIPAGEGDVILAGELSDGQLLTLSAAVAARGSGPALLIDSAAVTPYTRAFLASYGPRRVIPVGDFAEGRTSLERRLDVPVTATMSNGLCLQTDQAVVCPAEPRDQLLQAACLAGTLHARLIVASEESKPVDARGAKRIVRVGSAANPIDQDAGAEIEILRDAAAAAAARERLLARRYPLRTVVVANPTDARADLGGMSLLAPLVALHKHAPLVLTNDAGDDAEAKVLAATRSSAMHEVDTVILVANLRAVPMAQRPNPIPEDKDPLIEMEPLTPRGAEPFSFATGRLFHENRAVVPLLLARQALLTRSEGPRRALVASNPRGDMSLLEAFSRNTVHELRNAGYETTALFGKDINADDLRRLLPEHDVFLWEGHHNPLINDFGFPGWDEPLPPALVFLQSCLALKESKAGPLLSRGAVGVVGSSTRTYSASGGACSLAFFDALLYDGESLGGALRQSKNFLLAYSLLKEKRLGKDAMRAGANLRSAWAFTLWGDPTLQLPRPPVPADALPAVRHEVRGNTVVVHLPAEKHAPVASNKYRTEMMPNARLAGLLLKGKGSDTAALAPFVFAEVHLPNPVPGRTPRLHTKLPADRYIFCWDSRRSCGYLLITPGTRAEGELRFRVQWYSAGEVAAAIAP